jgi:cation-transporting ATPase E
MVGDGVNDVLALKQAELGIAMGTGNRMSRDVSDIVLLKDDFTVMPEVFSEGETIISNIQSSAKLFITKNTTAVFLILCAGFLGLAFPFVPRHVTIIGFFAISVPALLLAFSHRIQFVPHNFLKDVLGFATISGLFIGLSGLMSFTLSRVVFGQSDEVARTALLTQLVLLSLLNFLIIVGQNHLSKYLRQNWGLVFFALGFASLYFVLLWTTTQIEFLAPIATFLELHTLSIGDMVTAILLTPIAAIGLVFSQKRFLSTLSHPSQK